MSYKKLSEFGYSSSEYLVDSKDELDLILVKEFGTSVICLEDSVVYVLGSDLETWTPFGTNASQGAIDDLKNNVIPQLNHRIDILQSIGKFLALWDCITGKPVTFPIELPYEYHTGDYYIIDTVNDSGDNYIPTGTQYTDEASTETTEESIARGDFYFYDGQAWSLLKNTSQEIVYDDELSDTSENAVQNKVITKHLNEFGRTKCIKFTYDSTSNTYSCEYTFSELLDLLEDGDSKDILFYAKVDGYSQTDDRNVPYYLVGKNSTVINFESKKRSGDTFTREISYYPSGSIFLAAKVTHSTYASGIDTDSAIGSASQPVYVNSYGDIVAGNIVTPVPQVTSADNGKVLGVVNGQYTPVNAGGSGPLVVNLTNNSSDIWTSDKTFSEILAAGTNVEVHLREYDNSDMLWVLRLSVIETSYGISFWCQWEQSLRYQATIYTNNSWYVSRTYA